MKRIGVEKKGLKWEDVELWDLDENNRGKGIF